MKSRFHKLCALLSFLLMMAAASACASDVQDTLYSMPDDLDLFNGKLYAMCYDGLYTPLDDGSWRRALDLNQMQLGDRYITPLGMDAAQDELYLLAAIGSYGSGKSTYEVYLTTACMDWLTGLEPVCTLDLPMEPDTWVQCSGFVVEGSTAYMLLQTDVSGLERSTLYRVDLTTGSCTILLQDYLSQLQAWKDGLMIAHYRAELAPDTAALNAIVSIAPLTGATRMLAEMPSSDCGGLVYDAASDAVYVASASYLYRFSSDLAEVQPVSAMLPTTCARSNIPAMVQDGQYIIVDWEDDDYVTTVSLDGPLPTQTLRITSTYLLTDIIRDFARENPHVAVVYVSDDATVNLDSRLAHMRSEQAADIYNAALFSGELSALIQQGAAANLSGSSVLMDTVSGMYPHMTQSFLTESGLYALPVALSATMNGYDPEVLARVGLTEEDLPSTMDELLDFVLMWYEKYSKDYPDVQLWDYLPDLRSHLFGMILTMQHSLCQARSEALTFDTTIQNLLNKLDRVMNSIDRLTRTTEATDEEDFYDFTNSSLFTSYYDPMPSLYWHWDGTLPLPLSLDSTSAPWVNASMMALYINPFSEHVDLALELMEYIAAHLPQDLRIAMLPDASEPIEYKYYTSTMRTTGAAIQELEAQLESTCEESEKAELIMMLDDLKLEYDYVAQHRWTFSEEDIAAYRKLAPYLVVTTRDDFTAVQDAVAILVQRYLDHEVSTKQFLYELNSLLSTQQATP